MGTLDGKVAWVTGAGTGIGKAGAEALAAAGATVVLSGRRAAVLDQVAEGIVAHGGAVEVEPLDVSNKEAVIKAADRIFGRNRHVDILVNDRNCPVDLLMEPLSRLIPRFSRRPDAPETA